MLILLGTTLTTSFWMPQSFRHCCSKMLLREAMVKKQRHIWFLFWVSPWPISFSGLGHLLWRRRMGRAPAFPSGGRASVIRPRSRATYWPSVHIFWRSSAPQNTAQQCLRVRRGKIPFQPCSAFPVRTGRGLLRRRIDQRALPYFGGSRFFGELVCICAGCFALCSYTILSIFFPLVLLYWETGLKIHSKRS